MLKTKETEEIRRIKRWYDQITQGLRPTKAELESQFRGYVDQAALLIQRIDEGQPWEDFKLGIEGAPAGLLRRLSKMDFEGFTSAEFNPDGSLKTLAENTGVGGMSHQRNYPGRVQDPQGEDGCL